ncbi:cell division protein SepF [Romboutsia sp. CE17]|uniref:cell division protein SepF n=1 Tax=Romboutsia sp. CE17 TaxID=2724150 RepID=UPI001442C4A7|nr:cell division protein SepF [Romboutsia sp. CE17]QJA09254.1 cell division protein SepF [Romboutsia sp. CE17]
MGDGIISKIKDWVTSPDEEYYEDDYMEEEVDELEHEIDEDDDITAGFDSINSSKSNKIVSLHTVSQMKVVILEPKKYEDVTTIADHLKQRRALVVNLDSVEKLDDRKAIFNFMNGAVYVLEGNIQKITKSIFILAPSNVDIDSTMKKELESKTTFPWQK